MTIQCDFDLISNLLCFVKIGSSEWIVKLIKEGISSILYVTKNYSKSCQAILNLKNFVEFENDEFTVFCK